MKQERAIFSLRVRPGEDSKVPSLSPESTVAEGTTADTEFAIFSA